MPKVALLLLVTLAASGEAWSQTLAAVRAVEAEVQSMPILERPNRFGHFYGNTVRRRHYGTLNVNALHSDRPVARYFYAPR